MFDFSRAVSHRRTLFADEDSSTSTALARSYGLSGEWGSRLGAALFESFLAQSSTVQVSRLAVRSMGLTSDGVRFEELPAVAGHTIPNTAGGVRILAIPNWVGAIEATATATTLAVAIEPALAGDLRLPDETEAVLVLFGDESISLTPGNDVPIDGLSGALARTGAVHRVRLATGARDRARLLAKQCVQIRGAEASPSDSGRFVLTTPVAVSKVLERGAQLGVRFGEAVELPEYPGGIAVTCSSKHSDTALDAFTTAMTDALSSSTS